MDTTTHEADYIILFSSPPVRVSKYTNEEDLDDLLLHLNMQSRHLSSGTEQTYDKFVFKDPKLSKLKAFCDEALSDYTEKILKSKEAEMQITQSWVNVGRKGQHHHKHLHYNSVLSGVFYLQAAPDNPPLVFENDRVNFLIRPSGMEDDDNPSIFLADNYAFPPERGNLIIFPSTFIHAVPTNTSGIDRVSLSFNAFPKRPIGKVEYSTYLEDQND